ncbi:MAG: mechanosensitive ion channel domain-containing protein [Cyanobacteria bacterium P01_G01_bin.49]
MRKFLKIFEGIYEVLTITNVLWFCLLVFLIFLVIRGLSYLQIKKVFKTLVLQFSPEEVQGIYQHVFAPYQNWLRFIIILIVVNLLLILLPDLGWLNYFELPISILSALNINLLGFKLFEQFFDQYLLEVALQDRSKVNTELLVLSKFLSKAVIVLVVIFVFAQTHQINIIGLVASVSFAGAAVAFGSQKIIEQILWSVALYVDRPFNVDDYIHLPDRTIGKVESIGWRSTKVRLSGKNTLVIVPNSNLAQVSIENLTRAERVVSMVSFTFFRAMSNEEKALIHQLILSSTRDILGIDNQLTQVTMRDLVNAKNKKNVQAQVIFFILGTSEISMELRRGLLEIARDNIIKRLHEYGIDFNFEEKILDISQPMNI